MLKSSTHVESKMLVGHFSALQVVISGWCSRAQYHSCPIRERNLEKCIATFYSAQQTVNMHTAKSTAKKSHSKAWNHQCRCTQSCMSRQFTSHHKIMELYFSAEWETLAIHHQVIWPSDLIQLLPCSYFTQVYHISSKFPLRANQPAPI